MKILARYLEQLATAQYLHARGLVFHSDDDAFWLGGILPRLVVLAHFMGLVAIIQVATVWFQLPPAAAWTLRLLSAGLMLAVIVFLQTNTPYLQQLRERIRFDSYADSSKRERTAFVFVVGSLLLIPLAILVLIFYAT